MMVSLSRSVNTNSGGATFFSESEATDDREYLQPILASYGVFKPLRTVHAFNLHLLASLAIEVAALVFTWMHPDEKNKCREYFIVIYAHVGLWFLTLIVDQIARAQHHALRLNGYLDFYKQTQLLHRSPLYIVSLINSTLMLLQGLIQHIYEDKFQNKCLKGGPFSPVGYLSIIISFEFFVIAVVNISYIMKVRRFNSVKPPPDVQREEWAACYSPDNFAQGEIGYRQLGDKVYDFLEKQADLIRHLKDHNERLGQKLMLLTAQLQARNRSGA